MAEEAVTPVETSFESGVTDSLPAPETPAAAVEPVAPDAGAVPTAPAAWSFKYGDREFKSPDEAQGYFNSWNGRLSAQARTLNEFREENTRWAKWYEDRKDLIEKAEAARDVPKDKQPEYLDAVDWTYVEKLLKAGDGQKALQYIAYTNGEYLKRQFEAQQKAFDERFQSTVAPMQERTAARDLAIELFTAAQDATDEKGNAIYPEFVPGSTYNENFVRTFAAVFRQLPTNIGFDPEGYGVDLAYHRTKALMSAVQRPAQVNATRVAAEGAVRDATGRFVKQTEVQASAIGGSQTEEPGNEPAGSGTALKRAIKNAGKYNADLGVWE